MVLLNSDIPNSDSPDIPIFNWYESMLTQKPTARNPWLWVPSLYVAEGIPYVMAMTVSVVLYKRLGISNTDIALYTSWLYLPWVIKPLWSPFVDLFGQSAYWILLMQLVIGRIIGLHCVHHPDWPILPVYPCVSLADGLQLSNP